MTSLTVVVIMSALSSVAALTRNRLERCNRSSDSRARIQAWQPEPGHEPPRHTGLSISVDISRPTATFKFRVGTSSSRWVLLNGIPFGSWGFLTSLNKWQLVGVFGSIISTCLKMRKVDHDSLLFVWYTEHFIDLVIVPLLSQRPMVGN